MFHGLRHPELDRARIVAAIAAGRDTDGASESGDSWLRCSVHELCETSFHNWIRTLCPDVECVRWRSIAERLRLRRRYSQVRVHVPTNRVTGAGAPWPSMPTP